MVAVCGGCLVVVGIVSHSRETYDWNETAVYKLREMWAEGHVVNAIARALRVSRNAVVGKAHRLKLTPRPSPLQNYSWTEATVALLRKLWSDGHSVRAIGRSLSLSAEAVNSKAHRLHLTPRPSPIGMSAETRRAMFATLPPLDVFDTIFDAPDVAEKPDARKQPALLRIKSGGSATPVTTGARVSPLDRTPKRYVASSSSCCWPIGDPGTRGFRFCDATAPFGRSYCKEHAALAYVRRPVTETASA